MSKLADYSQTVTVDQLDAALRAGAFEGVFHYLAGTPGFALRIEDPAIVEGIRAKGWPQAGIDIPRDPINVDGAGTGVRARDAYGCPPGTEIYLDIEPARFARDPASWPRAADGWCDAIREAGFVPGVYGTDETISACANHADRVWRAKPGECDPAGPGLAATFFAGNRIIQCGSGVWGDVEFDVSYSQFEIGGDPMKLDASFWTGLAQVAIMAMHNQNYGKVDPGGQAVASLAATLQDRYVNGNSAQPGLNAILDGWTASGTGGDTTAVTDEEINVAAHVSVLRGEVDTLKAAPPGALPPHTHDVTTSGTSGNPKQA